MRKFYMPQIHRDKYLRTKRKGNRDGLEQRYVRRIYILGSEEEFLGLEIQHD